MLREAKIPFLMWLPAAMVVHALGGGGAVEGAKVLGERADILAFARSVRQDVRESLRISVEVIDMPPLDQAEEPDEPEDDDAEAKSEPVDEDEQTEPPKKPPPVAEVQPPKKPLPPEPKKPEPKKPEPKKVVVLPKPPEPPKPEKKAPPEPPKEAKKEPTPVAKPKAPQVLELPKPDGRIAVINDPSLDESQQDNPNARRIADHANKVAEETMARFRAYDQNTSKPTGGGQPTPLPFTEPGNSLEDRGGFSNEVPGEEPPRAGSESGPSEPETQPAARSQDGSNEPSPGQEAREAQKGVKARAAGEGPMQADPITRAAGDEQSGGAWSIDPGAGDGRKKQSGRKARKAIAGQTWIPGVPNPGALPQQYSINAFGLIDALGAKHLKREQEKARNTRKRRHRGSFKANTFQEYRAAIENYDPSVKLGNQTSLNAARVPFAAYINTMHNRIHPIFADSFLGSLGKLDGSDKLSDLKLSTHLELVLDGQSGAVVRAGVVRSSGVTAFDVAALSSAKSAGPFGLAPDVIVSPDGKVYVHWEFYRDPYYACTSKFARPYLIQGTPDSAPAVPGPGPRRPTEGGSEGRRTAQTKPLRPESKAE